MLRKDMLILGVDLAGFGVGVEEEIDTVGFLHPASQVCRNVEGSTTYKGVV
jgi:hypothetical protein